jgi:hypothetical protein
MVTALASMAWNVMAASVTSTRQFGSFPRPLKLGVAASEAVAKVNIRTAAPMGAVMIDIRWVMPWLFGLQISD